MMCDRIWHVSCAVTRASALQNHRQRRNRKLTRSDSEWVFSPKRSSGLEGVDSLCFTANPHQNPMKLHPTASSVASKENQKQHHAIQNTCFRGDRGSGVHMHDFLPETGF